MRSAGDTEVLAIYPVVRHPKEVLESRLLEWVNETRLTDPLSVEEAMSQFWQTAFQNFFDLAMRPWPDHPNATSAEWGDAFLQAYLRRGYPLLVYRNVSDDVHRSEWVQNLPFIQAAALHYGIRGHIEQGVFLLRRIPVFLTLHGEVFVLRYLTEEAHERLVQIHGTMGISAIFPHLLWVRTPIKFDKELPPIESLMNHDQWDGEFFIRNTRGFGNRGVNERFRAHEGTIVSVKDILPRIQKETCLSLMDAEGEALGIFELNGGFGSYFLKPCPDENYPSLIEIDAYASVFKLWENDYHEWFYDYREGAQRVNLPFMEKHPRSVQMIKLRRDMVTLLHHNGWHGTIMDALNQEMRAISIPFPTTLNEPLRSLVCMKWTMSFATGLETFLMVAITESGAFHAWTFALNNVMEPNETPFTITIDRDFILPHFELSMDMAHYQYAPRVPFVGISIFENTHQNRLLLIDRDGDVWTWGPGLYFASHRIRKNRNIQWPNIVDDQGTVLNTNAEFRQFLQFTLDEPYLIDWEDGKRHVYLTDNPLAMVGADCILTM